MREITEGERTAFFNIVFGEASYAEKPLSGIGTYKEKSLHRILKYYFEPDWSYHEIPYCGFVADIKRGESVTEIQTRSLARMEEKLSAFLRESQVRIVFPIETDRCIVWIDPDTGSVVRRVKSPKHENKYSLLAQLIYVLNYIPDDKLTVTAVYISTDEYRMLDGIGKDRKKRSTKLERIPTDIFGVSDYRTLEDFFELAPESAPPIFTRNDFSSLTGLRGRDLWAGLKVLERLGVISRVSSPDRKNRYRLNRVNKCEN